MGLCNVAHVAGSPPCQPWSGAGYCSGLGSKDGAAFLCCVKWAALAHVQSFTAENVPGFPRHPDFQVLTREADEAGMSLRLHGVYQANVVIPVQRDRWLGTFLHKDVGMDVQRLRIASSFSFAQGHLSEVCVRPCIVSRDVIHVNLGEEERRSLVVSDAAFRAMGGPRFAPKWLLDACDEHVPERLVEGRIISWHEPFQGFMASYGKQHEIDSQLLATKGLHTMVFYDNKGLRMISPWEMVATLAFDKSVVLPSCIHDAWRVAGNALSPVQAFLQLFKTHILLGDGSPFVCKNGAEQTLKEILNDAIRLSHHETLVDGEFWVLIPVSDDDNEDNCKRRKIQEEIDPTVPFEIDEAEDVVLNGMKQLPCFGRFDDPRFLDQEHQSSDGGYAVLLHGKNQWAMFVSYNRGAMVSEIIQRGLPHARIQHFHDFAVDDVLAKWTDIVPVGKTLSLKFHANHTTIRCVEHSIGIKLLLECDVTWTARTACSLIAAKVGCVPDAVGIFHEERMMNDHEYLLGYDIAEAEFRFKACLPGYVSWESKKRHALPPTCDPGMVPAGDNDRWCAKHPFQKVVRTAVTDSCTTVAQLVAVMFPDVHATVAWIACSHGITIDANDLACKFTHLSIQWDSFRPLTVTDLKRIDMKSAIDAAAMQTQCTDGVRRAVRSPFKAKCDEIWLPKNTTLAEIAASYFATSKVCTSVICHHGSAIVDPGMLTEQTPAFSVLSFRVCPLVGGAKHENVKQKVRQLMLAKGVPNDEINARVSGFFAKVAPEKLVDNMKDSDSDLWNAIKKHATDCKFRLILPAELKTFQQEQRKNAKDKPDKNAIKQDKKKQRIQVTKQLDAHAVTVDPNHFIADGEPIALLELARFGPDMAGGGSVTPAEARQVLKNAPWSLEALALLVIGEGASSLGKTQVFPAHTISGEPTTIDACLVQFGDVAIEPAIRLPSVVVDQMPSTVIEFSIERKLVGNWTDTAVPLHYVGVHVVALRGSALLATWSIKSWKQDRQTHYSQASHWHGFFRISDAILDQVLTRSGVAGIFMSPKTNMKKHDPRYVVIPMPNKDLPDVQARAETCTEVVGIVKLNDGFAVRCKREDASTVRSQLLPESAYVETATFDADQTLFCVKNVPQVGRDELSSALQKLGWQATAVRPQGVNRWVVAARQPPPCSHLVLNGTIATVDAIHGSKSKSLTVVTQEFKMDTVMDAQNQVVSVSTSARYAEMRAQVESQIATAVDNRLAQANARIEELSTALESMKSEQAFTKQKIAEVETTVNASSHAIIEKMSAMFKEMDSNMRATMQAYGTHNDPEKRARVDEMPKHDAFATKA
eukprot:Skav207457  [mRNA]  locus=scaffold3545:140399:144364:+ [translate_table: standard]